MLANPPLPIQTERLVLRAYRDTDVDATLAYYGDHEVSRFLLTEPFTRADAEQAVAQRIRRTSPQQAGDKLALVVEHDARLVGDIVLEFKGDLMSIAEVGWVFHPAAGGRGFATEAARAVVDLAFQRYAVHRVVAQLDARNVTSARLCERLGMTREAYLRRDWFSKGEWTDTLIYGVLAEEWSALPRT
ncbi:MAG: GNAT family N-acetyltransferase [Micromonosporaceae bacterium]